MDHSINHRVNRNDNVVLPIINTSLDTFGAFTDEKCFEQCESNNTGVSYLNAKEDIVSFEKLKEFTASFPGHIKSGDKSDIISKGRTESGKELLSCRSRASSWGRRENDIKVLAKKQLPGITSKGAEQFSYDVPNTARNDCFADEDAHNIDPACDFDDAGNEDIPSFRHTVRSQSDYTPKHAFQTYTRTERLQTKLSLARRTITEQRSVIGKLEKKLFHIAENVCAAPQDLHNDAEMLHSEFERAKKIIRAQCHQLEIYRSLIDKLKTSKSCLKAEFKSLKKERNALEDSVDLLRRVVFQLQCVDNLAEPEIDDSDSDVLCLHDNFFKDIKTDLFQELQLEMESVVCDHLSDALLQLESYNGKPRVVVVHTGKNDVSSLDVEEMCTIVSDIHACVTNIGSKLIMCNITPSYEKYELAQKEHLFNWTISSRLGGYDNVTVCKGNGLNDRELLTQEYGCSDNGKRNFARTVFHRSKPYYLRDKENYSEKRTVVSTL